jgi:fumarate reductase iron-sulfur subunit
MSGRDLRVCRDTMLAYMGHILESQYGEEALDALMKWNDEKTRERWKEIAKSTGRSDPEYLFCLFSQEAHDFEVIRKDRKALEVKVTKCIHAENFKKLNAAHIGQKLICNGDNAVTEGFNPKIKFTRPKLIMTGDDCCHFIWELQE